jgi:methylmalonyl-CoA/ethylmalonyl-CoA epimerase
MKQKPEPATRALPIDHIGIACRDLEAASRPYRRMGYVAGPVEDAPGQNVRLVFLSPETVAAPAPRIELLAPAPAGAGPITRFLDKQGEGLHHLAFRTPDLPAELDRLRGEGYEAIEAETVQGAIRPGAGGTRVAFLHPRAAGGVLIELVQHP